MNVRDRRGLAVRLLDRLDEAPEGFWALALSPLGAVYVGLGRLLRGMRRPRPLPVTPPTIGVGNLRVGGTGKTPVVADLALRLRDEGWRVAVLTRGFRGQDGADEPGWLADRGLDVIVGADRARGHAEAARRGAEVVLLDDALQCRDRPLLTLGLVLDRDLARMPRPLPAGPAREGAQALDRAAVWLVRRESDPAPPGVVQGDRAQIGFRLAPVAWIDPAGIAHGLDLAKALGPVLAVSGLARPRSFEADLVALGCEVVGVWRGPDHGFGAPGDLADIESYARRRGARTLVCPEKNRVRLLAGHPSLPLWCLRSELEWETGDPLGDTGIRELLGQGR